MLHSFSEVPSIRSDRQIPDTTTSNLDEKQGETEKPDTTERSHCCCGIYKKKK